MPTQRLSDSDKSWIESQFSGVLVQAGNNIKFPIELDDLKEWVVSTMPDHIRNPYETLLENAPRMLRDASYCSYGVLYAPEGEYELCFNGNSDHFPPNYKIEIGDDDPMYDAIRDWARDYHTIQVQVNKCRRYIASAIEECTSAGQIARIFHADILRFLPHSTLSSLEYAERKSRVPRGFTINPEMTEMVANTMALGSVCPDRKQGLDVDVSSFEAAEVEDED